MWQLVSSSILSYLHKKNYSQIFDIQAKLFPYKRWLRTKETIWNGYHESSNLDFHQVTIFIFLSLNLLPSAFKLLLHIVWILLCITLRYPFLCWLHIIKCLHLHRKKAPNNDGNNDRPVIAMLMGYIICLF